jgi:hypothetical protein
MQKLLVVLIIAAVLIWLGLRLFRACRSDSCKGCPGCGARRPPASEPVDTEKENCG